MSLAAHSSAPFPMSVIIDRLRDRVPELETVEGAAQYAVIQSLSEFRTPCAYALLARESGDGLPAKAGGRQRATVSFGVVLAVRTYRGNVGDEALGEASPLIAQARAALMGWTPSVNGARPCRWIDGGVLDFNDTTLLWSDVFQTQHFIGETP